MMVQEKESCAKERALTTNTSASVRKSSLALNPEDEEAVLDIGKFYLSVISVRSVRNREGLPRESGLLRVTSLVIRLREKVYAL